MTILRNLGIRGKKMKIRGIGRRIKKKKKEKAYYKKNLTASVKSRARLRLNKITTQILYCYSPIILLPQSSPQNFDTKR